jgi:hypothetical protein
MSVSGDFPRGPEQGMSSWYGASVRNAARVVGGVPRSLPRPARLAAQVVVAVLAVAFVLLAWILATLALLLTSFGRTPSGRH